MQYALYTAIASCIITIIIGPFLIKTLTKLKTGQNIRDDGPQTHLIKKGTPSMGGIIMLIAMTISTLIFAELTPALILVLIITLGHGLLGFLDDFIKIVLKRSMGLKAKEKFLGQVIMAIGLAYFADKYLGLGTDLWIPFVENPIELGILYYVLIFFVLVGTTNAVNLTDGLDGLAAGTTLIAAGTYAIIASTFNAPSLSCFCAATAGACLGFLRFNSYPAKVFMGDTGSLALGAALATVAVLTKTEFLLLVVGGVYVLETLSVIIQVTSFKTTGKRVFKMSPLHHHFELLGYSETKVVTIFWAAGLVFTAVALIILLFTKSGGI
ncbi:phospho-N-acetylmuramoyl-pentapeptide-transferase [Selenomonadales bacterium OttesenSCG-928-I06]|nr:phospho-N-acetylmuramoyl-pentapeptide-transferase [Selenomonadales bacterium OttesenSCG-928-I06]